MLPNTTANISDGSDNHVYDLRSVGDNKAVRCETAAPIDRPASLTVSHVTTGSGLKTARRTLVRFDRTVEDALGNQAELSAYVVLSVPIKITDTTTATKTLTELLTFFTVSTYKTQVVNGEI